MSFAPTNNVFAAPSNDSITGATVITSLPFTDTVDASSATADESDPQDCNSGQTLWYAYTPTVDSTIAFDGFGSNFTTGSIAVFSGSPGALENVTCGYLYSGNTLQATAGTTYYFMVSGFNYDCDPECGNTFQLNVGELPPPLHIGFTVDRKASFNSKTGAVTLHGTLTCNSDIAVVSFGGQLRQRVGRVFITGDVSGNLSCTSGTSMWTASLSNATGVFKGSATIQLFASGCDLYSCDSVDINQQMKLSGGSKR